MTHKELVSSLIAEMRSAVSVSRPQLAAQHKCSDDDPRFRTAFSRARNELVKEGVDFKASGKHGLYTRADGKASLRRSGNDRAAALAKLSRSVDKARKALSDTDVDLNTKDAIGRAAEKSEAMLGAALALNRKRKFDNVTVTIGHGNDNPRVAKRSAEVAS